MLQVIALIIIVVMMAVNSYNVYAQAPPTSGLSQLENKTLTNSTNNTNVTAPSSGIYQLERCVQGNSSYAMFKSCLASLNRPHILPPPSPPFAGPSKLETDNSTQALPRPKPFPPSSGVSELENKTVPSSGVSKLETDNSSQSISTNNQSSLPEPQILNHIPSSGLSRLEGRLYTNKQSDIGNLTNQTSPH